MKIEAGKEYRSRRGERVLVTAVEDIGLWPVHFIVMDGRYKGVGRRDGCRLRIDGRSTEPKNGCYDDHWNDLVEEWESRGYNAQSSDAADHCDSLEYAPDGAEPGLAALAVFTAR